MPLATVEDEWLWGWDPTPGIVSVWAAGDGRVTVWRRLPESGVLVREQERFRPWLLLDRLDDLRHLGGALQPIPPGAVLQGANSSGTADRTVTYRELDGPGALRFLVSADDERLLRSALLAGASARLGHRVADVRALGTDAVLALPPDEQYLVATGRTYFRDLSFDQLHRLQFDLETTGLDSRRDRIFMISVRHPSGETQVLEAAGTGDAAEADLIRRLVAAIQAADPDVIENHNLHGFDLPFVDRRARLLGVPLGFGRVGPPGLRQRAARRGTASDEDAHRRVRFVAPGRELIDTLDAVRRYDYTVRALPSYGLKAVARYLGLAGPERELIRGDQIYTVYQTDPARVRRYAAADVEEVAALSRTLGGPAFALARMVPRRYERLADAGAATGMLDPLLVRAYLRSGAALPAHQEGDGTPHSGAALHLFATGVAWRVVKADVASLYPSLMRTYRIGPARDHLGALLALVDRLVEQRLAAKASARAAPPGSAERHAHEAMSAAMKLVVNSAYGYLAAGGLTRFADVHAANEVTRRGRETLDLMCRALANRGVTLLEADTDGVYFAVPPAWTAEDERRVVAAVAALLPPLVQLELEGRYFAMLSHEPKNYALLGYDDVLILRGVAFRSARAEPFGEAFLRRALARLLAGDVPGVRTAYLDSIAALRRRALPTHDVSSRVRLTKTPERYLASRERRREAPYEALLATGRTQWSVGERVRTYRTRVGTSAIAPGQDDEDATGAADPHDYDVAHYERILRDNFAVRLARAFTPLDFAAVFADPDQHALFATPLEEIRPILVCG
ncbi:MAG TPA: 3'-5' exonuclease, partial [Gemmatimonadaceae bacterium]|nr:3'-5' exonuclease [Gemmatimonadaceae bacterium]